MQSDVGRRKDFAAVAFLPVQELQTGIDAEKATLSCPGEERSLRRTAAFCIAGSCLLAVGLAVASWIGGTKASAGRSATGLTLGLDVRPAAASAARRRPASRVPREELTRKLRDISRSLHGSGEHFSRVFKELVASHEATNFTRHGIARSLGSPQRFKELVASHEATNFTRHGIARSLGTPQRRLRPITWPTKFWMPKKPIKNKATEENETEDESEETSILYGYCGLSAENIVYSLGIVGLAVDGMSKTCPDGKPDSSAIDCGAFFSAMISELSWAASSALTMPETCGLQELEAEGCAADSTLLVANVFEVATDGMAAKITCFEGQSTEVEAVVGGRRLGGGILATPKHPAALAAGGAGAPAVRGQGGRRRRAAAETALQAMGLVGGGRRHGGLRGASSSKPRQGRPEDSNGGDEEDSAFIRSFDVAACYLTAENTANTAVDTVFSVMEAVEACHDFQETEEVEYQKECAGAISNFLSDIATVVSNAATMASICPVVAPTLKVACASDWSDMVATLANFAYWGASFGPDCLD